MNGVRSVLAYNDKISTIEKYLNTPNTGLPRFTNVKINMELNYNLVKNTWKALSPSRCFVFFI